MQSLTHAGNAVVPEQFANPKTERVQRLAMLGDGQFRLRIAQPEDRPAIDELRKISKDVEGNHLARLYSIT